jgi:hypothetical protein
MMHPLQAVLERLKTLFCSLVFLKYKSSENETNARKFHFSGIQAGKSKVKDGFEGGGVSGSHSA